MTKQWRNKKEPHLTSVLDPSTAIPLASLQRWSGTMKEVRFYVESAPLPRVSMMSHENEEGNVCTMHHLRRFM